MEKWQFKPGDVVRCAWRYSGDGNDGGIVAISLADSKLPKFAVGDRVLVSRHGGWKRNCLGTVVAGPEQTETRLGPDSLYWIEFDRPEEDMSGGHGYTNAQILSSYLNGA